MSKFLIVTSFYNNTKNHVQTTFDNVLKQSHQDWILIVGDDFSDDPEFRTYLKNQVFNINDPRIIYYNVKYKRELYLYQNFFKEYEYDYYFDLDSDDKIDPNLLNVYHNHFKKYPNVNSIYSDFNKVDEDNNLQMLSLIQSPSNFLEEFNLRSTQDFTTIYSQRSGQHMFGVARAMRRPKENKLPITELCRTATDSLFLFFNLTKGDHLHIPRKLYTYINRPNSDSSWMSPEEISKFNLNVKPYKDKYTPSKFKNPYRDIWLETSAISSCKWVDNVDELCLITNPNIDINLLKFLYPDKKIVLNNFTHKNQIVVWNNLNSNLKSKLKLNNTNNCTVFFSDEDYTYLPSETLQNFNNSSSAFRQELNQYFQNYNWYSYFRQCIVTRISTPKLLIITPHLSTGGSPQYILDYLKYYKDQYSEIKLVEFTEFSWEYVIQKNKLIKLLGKENVYTLGKYGVDSETFNTDKEKLLPILKDYQPDVIWMNEMPEAYEYKLPPDSVMETIYSPNRKYKVIETTHFNAFDFSSKKFIPDEFMFCSPKHIEESKHIDIPKKVFQTPIENKTRPDRNSTLTKLGLDPSKYHVLNVGLLNPNKNQKYIFDLAEKTQDLPIEYHFIGNHCFFNQTGITDTQKQLNNCKLWGERNDVDIFMSCMDLYLFPSKKELNPITIKEALSWGMDVIANYDENYTDQYKDLNNFKIIQDINIMEYLNDITPSLPKLTLPQDYSNEFLINFINGAKCEIKGSLNKSYRVKFYNDDTNELVWEDTITNNMWTAPSIKYYIKWRIEIWENNNQVHKHIFDLTNQKVYIHLDSKSVGDTLAWFPYVEEFRKKHNCEVICSTFKNFLFESTYPNIKFVPPGSSVNAYAQYNIGWFDNTNKNPNNVITIPLQQTATDILGLEYKEVKPKLSISLQKPSIKGKYVTLSIQSTAQCKYWNYKGGWQKIVNYLNLRGYKVVCIDKHAHFGVQGCMNSIPNNVIDKTGCSLEEASSLIKGAKFHLGISSGLSWLAWALNSHVVMVSSFSKPFCEFTKNITRIYTDTPYSGYFNDPNYKLDASNWNWNPYLEISTLEGWHDFETITPKQVIKEINKLL